MIAKHLSLVLIPTLNCNADCKYCYEVKDDATIMSLDQFEMILEKVGDYIIDQGVFQLTINWHGGEAFTIDPGWYMRAFDIINKFCNKRKLFVDNHLQTNLLGYNKKWNEVIYEMFDNQIGSSLDFPNLFRKTRNGSPGCFNKIWEKKFNEAMSNDIDVSVIAIPNIETFKIGASAFYSYFVNKIGLKNIQINTLIPGNSSNVMGHLGLLEENNLFGSFYAELLDIWVKNSENDDVHLSPFKQMIDYFSYKKDNNLPCIWQHDCSKHILSIDPKGNVSQCACWVTSYPEFRYGNILESNDLSEIMKSNIRDRFKQRPAQIIENDDCVDCDYLAICHGGCHVRAYSAYKSSQKKDPYCESYKMMFDYTKKIALKFAESTFNNKEDAQNK